MNILNILGKVFALFKKHPALILMLVGFESLFFFLYGFIYGFYFNRMHMLLEDVGSFLLMNSNDASSALLAGGSLVQVFSNPLLSGNITKMIILGSLWVFTLFFFVCLYQSSLLYILFKLVVRIKSFDILLKRFVMISVPLTLIYLIYRAMDYLVYFSVTELKKLNTASISVIPQGIVYLLLAVLLHIAIHAYPHIVDDKFRVRSALKAGFVHFLKKVSVTLSIIVVFILLGFAGNYLSMQFALISLHAAIVSAIVFAIVVGIPVLIFVKVLLLLIHTQESHD